MQKDFKATEKNRKKYDIKLYKYKRKKRLYYVIIL